MVNRKYIASIVLLIASSMLVRGQLLPTYGEERAGLSAFTFLKLPIDPASVGVGGASLAMTEHSFGALVNPALVSGGNQQGFFTSNRALGGGISHDFIALTKARANGQHIALTLNSLSTGSILERTVWQPEGTGATTAATLTSVGLGISQAFSEYFHAGMQLKYGLEQLGVYRAHNVYLDLGFLYKLDIADLQFAAALTNFGPNTPISNLPVGDESALAATPQMFSMGLQWTAWESGNQKLTPSFQLNHPTDNAEYYAAGLKYQWRSYYWTSMGYQVGSQKSMPWMGFGMKGQIGGWPMEWGVGAMPTPYGTYQGTLGLKLKTAIMVRRAYILLPIMGLLLMSCENYFGKRTDLDFIEIPTYDVREISYVPIAPNINDAQSPVDVHVGYDEFIYIVDSANDQVLRYDLALNLQGSITIPGVRKVVQNRSFHLLAIGTYDTTIAGVDYNLTALYDIDLVDDQNTLSFNNVIAEPVLVHPFYFKNSFSSSDAKVKFTDVAIIGSNLPAENNSYYLSRTGVSNNNAGFGPDYAVLKFTKDHQWISSIPVTATGATYSNYFKNPLALQGFTQAPQLTANNSPDFWVLNQSEDQEIQVQHIQFTEGPFGALYQPIFYSTSDPNSTGYLQTPKRFEDPVDLCLAGDGSRFLFVADAGVDSVYQFTSSGIEGVPPPPASTAKTNAITTLGDFGNVSAISYYDNILYVADSQTGVVKRFKLTLDFD